MSWLVIGADNEIVSGPHDEMPEAADGERVVEVALGCVWSPERRAFVEPRRRLSPLEFLQLLTPAEVVTIDTFPVATPHGQLLRYAARVAQAADQINLDGSEVAAFLMLAQQLQILTPERASRVLAGLAPEGPR